MNGLSCVSFVGDFPRVRAGREEAGALTGESTRGRGLLDSCPHAQYAHVMDSTLAALARWMPHQRWYSSKASAPRLRLLRDLPMASSDPRGVVRVLIVVDESTTPSVTYQVPVVERPSASAPSDHVIGTTADGHVMVDGPHDRAYTDALLSEVAPSIQGMQKAPGARSVEARVLSGEQSNTSIIFHPAGAGPVICKVFRQLHPGINPDIELQTALAATGSVHVPRAIGDLQGYWEDSRDPGSTCHGALAFAQEFLPGVEDAWRVALRAAERDETFAAPAHSLGAATADVHLNLARLFPTVPPDESARDAAAAAWRRRLGIAISEVPDLQRHHAAISRVYDRARGTVWPPMQRIHGDYHLGQVLHVPLRGWVLLDFEGEPMRPIRERLLPDSALRDVAGMLRSFDYVAGSLADHATAGRLRTWAQASREAFLGGYEHRSGQPATGPLLDAFELDKAVYEAIYESRNRPDWLSIPLTAIDRLVSTP